MTLLKFTKNISCDDITKCHENISDKIAQYLNTVLRAETVTDKVNGHVSISHKKGVHLIFLFLYSKNGVGESHSKNEVIKTPNDRVMKYKGEVPTVDQIKKII